MDTLSLYQAGAVKRRLRTIAEVTGDFLETPLRLYRNNLPPAANAAARTIESGSVMTHAKPIRDTSFQRTLNGEVATPLPTAAPVAAWVEYTGTPRTDVASTTIAEPSEVAMK
jgi:hypothetical protein